LTSGVRYAALFRGTLNKQLVILAAVFRVLSEEDAEDRVIAENVGVRNLLLCHRQEMIVSVIFCMSPCSPDYTITLSQGASSLVSTPSAFAAWLGIVSVFRGFHRIYDVIEEDYSSKLLIQ